MIVTKLSVLMLAVLISSAVAGTLPPCLDKTDSGACTSCCQTEMNAIGEIFSIAQYAGCRCLGCKTNSDCSNEASKVICDQGSCRAPKQGVECGTPGNEPKSFGCCFGLAMTTDKNGRTMCGDYASGYQQCFGDQDCKDKDLFCDRFTGKCMLKGVLQGVM